MSKTGTTTERIVRTVQALQRFSCYATLAEIEAAIGGSSLSAIMGTLKACERMGVVDVRTFPGSGKKQFYYWTGGHDLLDQQQRIASHAPAGLGHAKAPPPPIAPAPRAPRKGRSNLKATVEQVKQAVIACNGDKKAAAKMLGVSKCLIYAKLKQQPDEFLRKYSQHRRKERKTPQRSRGPAPPPPVEPEVFAPRPLPARPAPKLRPVPLASMSLDDLWLLHQAEPDDEVRAAIAEHYVSLVEGLAIKLSRKAGNQVAIGDMISAGTFGLLNAIDSFDPARGFRFETFAPRRIHGAMLDELRRVDWVPRLVRQKNGKLALALHKLRQQFGREPTSCELSDELGITCEELDDLISAAQVLTIGSLNHTVYRDEETGRDVSPEEILADVRAPDPSRRLQDADQKQALIRGLNKDERLLILRYYWGDKTMAEIGDELSLSESRVSQMHTRILDRMRLQRADQLLTA